MPDNNSNEKIKVNISVEELQFPITVSNTDEEKLYRKAATQIQTRLQQLRTKYPKVPNEKYYYIMAMINAYVEAFRVASKASNAPYNEMINRLEQDIDALGL